MQRPTTGEDLVTSTLHSVTVATEDKDDKETSNVTETDINKENVYEPETDTILANALQDGCRPMDSKVFIHPALAKGVAESIDAAYPINGRGFVLLINYSQNRQGSENDVAKLIKFFRDELRFEVEIGKDNMTRLELLICLDNTRTKMDYRFYCFVCIVMAHGNEIGIMTSDNKELSYNDILGAFDNRSMPQFAGRPKIFLINACRGERLQRPIHVRDLDHTETDAKPVPPTLVAETADIFAVYSTVCGFASYRDTQEGSIFIQSCVDVFQKYYKRSHICDMTTKIRREVQEKEGCQVSEDKTTLTKKMYFMNC